MSNKRFSGSTAREWSAWEWNKEYQCQSRYRQDRNGEWKWEYRPSPRGDTTPRDSSTDLYSLPEESLQEATQETAQEATQEDVQEHFRFDRAIPNLGVDNITQGIRDTTVNTNTQASSSYKAPPSAWVPSNEPRWIYTGNSNSKAEKADKNFKVHKSKEFSFGRVFKVLWSEPTGSGGTEITERGTKGGGTFQKQRRFLIVDTRKGHSICLPILTYGGQGTLKYGVHPEDHAAIYSSRKDGPCILPAENMAKEPIRVEVLDLSYKLDPMSRLNYAKLYTVEHNVKVLFIGKIAKKYEQKVVDAYNLTHQPLPDRPDQTAGTTDETFEHAEGQNPNYPQAMASSSSSWTGTSITRPPANDYGDSQDQYSTSWTGQSNTEPLANAYNNSQDQYSSSWTGQSSTEPPANDYDNSQDQYSSSWTGQSGTEPPAANYDNSQDQYEAPPNLYDAEE